ncbi:cache domain-containing sensor histidine kinase [Paenibacillus soyae]|uniref:histidine kinase n=1 Tax=Paenibacillus soyae TaxID=2969249 RepID=A0A9X2SAH6_9BACL|nr:sensor histidine kinase [Paenibacillus soyae]MCR2806301.1 sensor histidine kinase [Paenibacillus soyae]
MHMPSKGLPSRIRDAFTAYMNNVRTRKKLVFSYLLVVFLPVLVVGILLTNTLREQAVNHAVDQAANNMNKIKRQIEETLQIPEGVSNTIFFDRELMEIVSHAYESESEVFQAYRGYDSFTTYMELYKDIADIRLYVNNETLLENWSIFRTDSATEASEWFRKGLEGRGNIVWEHVPNPTKEQEEHLSLVRQVFKLDMDYIGMLVISVKPGSLYAILEQEPFETLIYTDGGEVVAAKDRTWIGKPIQDYLDLKEEPAKLLVESIEFESSVDRLHMVSIVPEETILKDARKVSLIAYAIVASSLLASCALILIFSSAMSKRISVLSQDMRKVARGDLKHYSLIQGQDEIGQLSRHFNHMVENIDDLMSQVRKADESRHELELKQREIRFKMLANQVDPHFLFNALETVRMKAHCNGEAEIADIVKSLGTLLRNNLEAGQGDVSFESELELTRMYLGIQHFRFGAKLAYRLPDPAEVQGIKVLPLLLQPIVENAIVHGIERKLGPGLVDVCIVMEPEKMLVAVKDDGVGIEAGKLRELVASLDDPEDDSGKRIGLRNVHQRMKLHYGPEYGLLITSRPGHGTTVILTFPKGEHSHV